MHITQPGADLDQIASEIPGTPILGNLGPGFLNRLGRNDDGACLAFV